VKEFNDNIIFLRRLVPGGTNKSYGIQVARLAGVPDKVIAKAKKILAAIESRDGDPALSGMESGIQSGIDGSKTKKASRISPKPDQQMDLFKTNDHGEIIAELEAIDVSTITPIQALNLIYNLKQKIRSKVFI